jgi:hypothetical protein
MGEPRRDHYLAPAVSDDSESVLEAALDRLAELRGLPRAGDAAVTLHLLGSLIAEAERRLPHAVADAKQQDFSWAQIGDLLGVTRASAWQRYSNRSIGGTTSLDSD